MDTKEQTARSFADKWTQNPSLAFAETMREGSGILEWILARNGFACLDDFRAAISNRKRILDAGCGNGRVTALLRSIAADSAAITAIDLVSADVASANLKDLPGVSVFQKDLLGDLAGLGPFDFIYCQEVLHHTADPRGAFLNLCSLLEKGGEIAIYVYRKKAPLREFADDYVRDKIAGMPYEEAMKAARQITLLGRALSAAGVKVKVPAVDVIGVEQGEYDIQRFIYHFILKCYWNPSLSFEDNMAINYDWYHPSIATRHTLDEVMEWFESAGLEVIHKTVDHYGITVRGAKPA